MGEQPGTIGGEERTLRSDFDHSVGVEQRRRGGTVGKGERVADCPLVANFALDFLPDAFSGDIVPLLKPHHERAIAAGIASGAAEIQLGIVATEYLNLPRS